MWCHASLGHLHLHSYSQVKRWTLEDNGAAQAARAAARLAASPALLAAAEPVASDSGIACQPPGDPAAGQPNDSDRIVEDNPHAAREFENVGVQDGEDDSLLPEVSALFQLGRTLLV